MRDGTNSYPVEKPQSSGLPLHRRRFLGTALNAAAASAVALPALASPGGLLTPSAVSASGRRSPAWPSMPPPPRPNEPTAAELMTDETNEAIARGLSFLASNQIKNGREAGRFQGRNGHNGRGVAAAGLGGLAFLCGGHVPYEGKYGQCVVRAMKFILKNVRSTGYIALANSTVHENMYGHGFAMLFLSEVYGMTQNKELGEKLRLAVDLTSNSQNAAGGWRYQPRPSDADLSVTVCQIMGLRAARDSGIYVSDDVRRKCIQYVRSCRASDGSFSYMAGHGGHGGRGSFAMTAAGITSLYSAGIYDGEVITAGLKRLKGYGISGASHFFYGHYYAVQAMWHAGGEHWATWYPMIRDALLKKPQASGSWNDPHSGGEVGTAMACIILQMPNNFVPVFRP